MGLRDRAVNALRSIFGRERAERESADSPSAYAQANVGPSSYSLSRNEDMSGMMTVSSHLMDRYGDYECVTGDTVVMTLSGPKTISYLAEECSKDKSKFIPLYTWDGEKVTVGIGLDARMTKRDKVYSVHLDDGTIIKATADHPFMLRNGEYRPVKDLTPGASLMPLYLYRDNDGRLIYQDNGDHWRGAKATSDQKSIRRVARMVAEWKLGERLEPNTSVEHLDEDQTNCDPDNIICKEIKARSKPGWVSAVTEAKELFAKHSNFCKPPLNHKVVKVVEEGVEPVYDISVPGTHNFAVGSYSGGVFIHNSMNEYPDINCLAKGSLVPVIDGSVIKHTPIEDIAANGAGVEILGFDLKKSKLTKVTANNPRLSSRSAEVIAIKLSNETTLRCTPDHKIFTADRGYVNAEFIKRGDRIKGLFGPVTKNRVNILANYKTNYVTVLDDPRPDGVASVFDITTETHNFIANGVVVHNSAYHYFANDAVQPDLETGRSVWVESNDRALKDASNSLLHKKLKVDDEIFSMTYTLCQYGNNFEEVLVTDNGVVGLNYLPPPSMRRVEHSNGAVIGYVQDPTGKFTDKMATLRGMLGGAAEIPPHLALFEDWQVLHMRLRSTHRRSPYGYCIPADGLVWTTEGPKQINDVVVGDRVLCRHAGMLRTTKVIDTFESGTKEVFRVKTAHREVRASENHPFLVRSGGTNRWKPLSEIAAGDEIMIGTEMVEAALREPLGLRLDYLSPDTYVRFSQRGCAALRAATPARVKGGSRSSGILPVMRRFGLTRKVTEDIKKGKSSVPLKVAEAILEQVGLSPFEGALTIARSGKMPTLPDFVTPSFAQLFGFLLGDGWVTKNGVHFSRGDNEDVNAKYEAKLFEETGLNVSISASKMQASVHSGALVRVLTALGWVNGAHHKRVPGWVFGQSRAIREAFLDGFVDADGWVTSQGSTRYHIELCNRGLVEDIKTLVDGLGWTCGNVRVRAPRTATISAGTVRYADGAVLPETEIRSGETFTITWSRRRLGEGGFAFEKVKSITSEGVEPTFDIGVADQGHNFICNGIVVHNSIADGARWIWKRLTILEDAVLVYRLCLRGDSQIWTPTGRVAIKELKEGDEVYSYTTEDKLKKTRVCYKKHNGQDNIYRVFSDHRDIFANKTHPVLVETVHGQGSGKPTVREVGYVEVQNLIPGVHRFMTPRRNDDDWKIVELKKPILNSKAKLKSPERVERKISYHKIAKEIGVHHYRARAFFEGNYELKTSTAEALLHANGDKTELLDIKEHWGGSYGKTVRGITIPDVADENFAQWFGFMLGDGFVTTRTHKNGYRACNEVGFALGADDSVNDYYKSLFELYAPVKLVANQGGRLGAYSVVSSKFAEFMKLNGFIAGAHNKRIPEWAFQIHRDLKIALLRGLADADAHISPRKEGRKTRYERWTFELCNEALVNDIRELAMQAGLVVTRVSARSRKGGRVIAGNNHKLPNTTSYTVSVSVKDQQRSEVIRGVEKVSSDDIWDIGVEADEHNFVSDGVVVHNTRAPSRYAFYIDVTDIPANKVESFLRKAKQDLKKKKIVNPRTGKLEMRYNPLSNDEDFFLASREGRDLARVETLAGPTYQHMEDIEYFQRKLHGVLKVPKEYLGQEQSVPARAILSNEDSRAARVTMNVQKELRNSFERLVRVDMAARGISDPFTPDLTVMMTAPSGIYALQALEVKNARADYASRIQPYVSTNWIRKNLFKLSEEEIEVIEAEKQREKDKEKEERQQALGGIGGGGGGGGGGGITGEGIEDMNISDYPKVSERNRGDLVTRYEFQKLLDESRRLEDIRDRESRKRHEEILDRVNKLVENDHQFAQENSRRSGFMRDFKSLLYRNNGRLHAAPANGRLPRK